jgi:hypothetical protein
LRAQRARTIRLDASALAAARDGLEQRFPDLTARRTLHAWQAGALLALAGAGAIGLAIAPQPTSAAFAGAALALFATAIAWRLLGACLRLSAPAAPMTRRRPCYTVLCPLYREANVVADLAAALDRLDYPKSSLDIKCPVSATVRQVEVFH